MIGSPRSSEFRDSLVSSALLIPLEVPGLYGLGRIFQLIAAGVDAMIVARGAYLGATSVSFPPLLPDLHYRLSNYAVSFPNLVGAIFTNSDEEWSHEVLVRKHERGQEWREDLIPSDLMLVSAACHPVFAMYRGERRSEELYVSVLGYCFRQEPSEDPMRMRAFRQREYVCIGDAALARAHRDSWAARGRGLLEDLGLNIKSEPASDPFFGRAGRLLQDSQRDGSHKIELIFQPDRSDVGDEAVPLASANYHLDHFGRRFGIKLQTGEFAHSACVGFGLERVTLALLWSYGLDVMSWPASVRSLLCL